MPRTTALRRVSPSNKYTGLSMRTDSGLEKRREAMSTQPLNLWNETDGLNHYEMNYCVGELQLDSSKSM